jgi:hypothetical protein
MPNVLIMSIFSSTSISCRNWSPNYSVLVIKVDYASFPLFLNGLLKREEQSLMSLSLFLHLQSSLLHLVLLIFPLSPDLLAVGQAS